MATFTDISELDGYEIPASGETIEINIMENYYGSYVLDGDNIVSFSAEDGNQAGEVVTSDTECRFYGLDGDGEGVTITFEVGQNQDQSYIVFSMATYDTEGELVGDYIFYQEEGEPPAPTRRKYITTYGGDGYFELGSITIDSNTIFKFKATPRTAPEGFWLGNWSNWYGIYHPVQSNIQNQLKWYSTGGIEGVFYEGQSLADILDHSFEIETSTSYVKVNGTTVSRNAPINQTFTSFHIGNSTNAGQYDAKKPVEWEYFQIYQGGVLALDLVPAFNNNQYCFKDNVTGNYIYGTGTIGGDVTLFSIDTDNITAEYSGASTSVTVTADEELSWTASTNDSWISLTNPSGTGDGGFTVSVTENKYYINRTGTVIITSSEGDVLTVTVEQEKKPLIVYDHPIYRSGSLVKKMYRSGNLIYLRLNPNNEPEPEYDKIPFTFEVLSAGTISWKAGTAATQMTIQYSINDGSWVSITSSTAGTTFNVAAGDKVRFKGTNSTYSTQSGGTYANTFGGTTAQVKVYGNIMSLTNGDNFQSAKTFSGTYVFRNLLNFSEIVDAEHLILPATALTAGCYMGMLSDSSITVAPNLPAEYVHINCYNNMFLRCTKLTTVQAILPATIVYESCYRAMFYGCTSLTTAPELPAKSLSVNANNCYYQMFDQCSKLNYIKCLATTISTTTTPLYNWVRGVAASGTFVKDSSMTGWTTGTNGIPSGWTVVNA